MIERSELDTQIAAYLRDKQSFEDFEDWLVESSRIAYLDNPSDLRNILGEIRFLMFQHIEGEIDEDEFRAELQKYAKSESQSKNVTIGVVNLRVRARSVSQTVRLPQPVYI
jgi:hypothetical protein